MSAWLHSRSIAILLLALVALSAAGAQAALPGQSAMPPVLETNIEPVPETEAPVTLYVNDRLIGDVEVRIDMDNPFLRKAMLRRLLEPYLSPAQMERIFGMTFSLLEWLGPKDLELVGFRTRWDMETLSYYIETPGEYTALREIDFSPEQKVIADRWLKPSPVAGVINFNLGCQLRVTDAGFATPLSLSATGLLNLWSVAVEYGANMNYSNSTMSAAFSGVRAVYDIPAIEGRLFAGMVGTEGTGYQSRPEIYGLTLVSIPYFSRYDKNYAPSVRFTLEKASMVRMKLNGAVIRILKLDKGNYRIYDIPFAYGLNEIELEVEDVAKTDGTLIYRPLTRFVATESGLLVAGKADYAVSVGLGRLPPYEPLASLSVRYGVLSGLTVGLNLQADKRSLLSGLSFIAGTDIGGLSGNAALLTAWDGRTTPLSFAGDLDYSLQISYRKNAPSLGLSFGYTGRGFSAPQPSSIPTETDASIKAGARLSTMMSQRSSIGFSANWNRRLGTTPTDSTTIACNLGTYSNKNTSFSISAGMELTSNRPPRPSLVLSFSATDPATSMRRISYSQSAQGEGTLYYSDTIPVGKGIGYSVQANNLLGTGSNPGTISVSSGISSQYFMLSGSAGAIYGGASGKPAGSLNLNLSTALSFAGGALAVSKPLYDAFVIFAPDRSTRGNAVSFKVESGSTQITRGWPIAAPLSSYRKVVASMDFPEANADVMATLPQAGLAPKYRSGFLYRGGLERLLYVTGRLLGSDGRPVALVAGDVLREDGSFFDQTFTDDDGNFQIYGLVPGTYRIVWPETVGVSTMVLPRESNGLVELGDILAEPVR